MVFSLSVGLGQISPEEFPSKGKPLSMCNSLQSGPLPATILDERCGARSEPRSMSTIAILRQSRRVVAFSA